WDGRSVTGQKRTLSQNTGQVPKDGRLYGLVFGHGLDDHVTVRQDMNVRRSAEERLIGSVGRRCSSTAVSRCTSGDLQGPFRAGFEDGRTRVHQNRGD